MGEEDREIETLGRFIRKQESYTIIGVCGRERRRWVGGGGRRERERKRERERNRDVVPISTKAGRLYYN